MLFVVAPCFVTPDVEHSFQSFQATQLRLRTYLQPKQYGEALQEFFIGFICVSPEYRTFAKPRRDSYTKERKVHYRDGLEIVREKTFECEVELPYETLLIAPPEEVYSLLSQEVIQAVERLYKHQHKLHSFAIAAFLQDVMHCLTLDSLGSE